MDFEEFYELIKDIAMAMVAVSDKQKAFAYFVENFTNGEIPEEGKEFVKTVIDQAIDNPRSMFEGNPYLDEKKMQEDFNLVVAGSAEGV